MDIKNSTPNILKKIVAVERDHVERLKVEAPVASLNERIRKQHPPLSLSAALSSGSFGIIAEVKKASPVKGLLRADFDPADLARTYVDNGAAAVSVLTNDHFMGCIEHLQEVRSMTGPAGVPVLRKEFIFDEYQVFEARAFGADAVLLIAAMLSTDSLVRLLELSGELGMEALVEVHDESELETALTERAEIIGINNRDLRTFRTDLEVTERLAPTVPADKLVVSESGISERDHIRRVQRAGARAALIGESLVIAPDPGAKLRGLA